MSIRQIAAEYRKREDELYDNIREASDEFARHSEAGTDATEAFRRLEAALAEYKLFRCS
ncbi:hypothetical protein SRRS_07810 [Sporomusa rhizae]|uniref:hypothetical protein n=1 Tax=Sporomusa rhizae TaxID=357999 RepID=UPI00352B6E43